MYKKILLVSLVTAGVAAAAEAPNRVPLAMDFGPVSLVPGQSLRICASNLYGDTPVAVNFSFLDFITSHAVVTIEFTLPAGQGKCFTHDLPASTIPGVAATSSSSMIGVLTPVANTRGGWNSPFTLGPSSAQVVDAASGKTVAFVPAVQRFNVVLPAVQ